MTEIFDKETLGELLPDVINKSDLKGSANNSMKEDMLNSDEVTPAIRRLKMVVDNAEDPTRIIKKGIK